MGQSTCEHDVRPTVEGGRQSELSAPDPYAGAPPRLCACLNGPTDEQPDKRIPDGTTIAPNHIEDILEWVTDRLEACSLEEVWKNPGGQHPNEAQLSDAQREEEEWAKLTENMFFGTAYGGPDVAHSVPGKGGVNFNICFLYSRLAGANSMYDEGSTTSLDDPAYSLWVACQHLTTYGALTRGVLLMEELNGAGFPASQSAAALKLFQPGGKGTWYVHSEGTIEIDGKEASFKKAPPNAHSVAAVDGLKEGQGAGAIYTYNPILDQKFALLRVPREFLTYDKDGLPKIDEQGRARVDEAKVGAFVHRDHLEMRKDQRAAHAADMARQRAAFEAGSSLLMLNRSSKPLKFIPTPAPDLTAQEQLSRYSDPDGALVQLNVQFEGSHISMVLRSFLLQGKPVVQLLDTSSHQDNSAAYAVLGKMDGSIFAGNAYPDVPRKDAGNFVGLGLLPPIRDAEIVFDNLRRARPVGLGRLIITRVQKTAGMKEDDVLFVSRMMPLWGEGAEQNFNLPTLLWSLRNTPYHETLRAHWAVYSPRGALASVMWEHGARSLSVDKMVDKALAQVKEAAVPGKAVRDRLTTGADTLPVAILSHETDGTCVQLWRNHGMKAGGVGTVDKLLREYFIDAGPPAASIKAGYDAAAKARGVWCGERGARLQAMGKELEKLANRDDAAAQDTRERLLKEKDTIAEELKSPPDFYAEQGLQKDTSGMQVHPLKIARDGLTTTYVPAAWRELGLALPKLLDTPGGSLPLAPPPSESENVA